MSRLTYEDLLPEDLNQPYADPMERADDYMDSCADGTGWTVEAAALYAGSLKKLGFSNEQIASQIKKDVGLTVQIVESPMREGCLTRKQAS